MIGEENVKYGFSSLVNKGIRPFIGLVLSLSNLVVLDRIDRMNRINDLH